LLGVRRELEIAPNADLTFDPGSLRFESQDFIDGQTIYIHAVARNIGGRDSGEAVVEAFKGEHQLEKNRIKPNYESKPVKIPPLKPGESVPVTLRWDDNHIAGTPTVEVWVNRDGAVPESDRDNNVIRKDVLVHPPSNFFIQDGTLRAEPALARPGQTVRLSGAVGADHPSDFSRIPLTFFSGNDQRGLKPMGPSLVHEDTSPTLGFPFEREATVSPEAHRFAVEVNVDHPVSESWVDDNRAETVVDLLVDADSLKADDGSFDLMPALEAGSLIGVRLTPAGDLSCGDLNAYPKTHYELTPDCLTGDFTTSATEDSQTDNRWLAVQHRVEASPEEDAPPLQISVPFPDMPATSYNVFLWVETNKVYYGKPATRVRVQLPGQPEMREFDFTDDVLPWNNLRYYVGRAAKEGDRLSFTVAQGEKTAWTVLRGCDVTPLTGTYLSPVIDRGRESRTRLRFSAEEVKPPGTDTAYAYRYGSLGEDGRPEWQDWTAFSLDEKGRSKALECKGRLLQWRVYLMAGVQGAPHVKSMRFQPDPSVSATRQARRPAP
ncbi:MAG: hypothetical protein NTW86_19780, partial [Candidatus Sumerlaeota bacterium]|nr:hypothetical protein [Candidatus Sumerlaeota bacterium]